MKQSKFDSVTHATFNAMKSVEMTLRNKVVFVALILTSAVIYVVLLGFNALAGNPNLIKNGPFHHSIGNISDMYPLRITPAGWAFSIWGVIYLLQFGSMIYSLGLLCRTTQDGLPAYSSPPVLSPLYFFLFILSCVVNVTWLFQWDRLYFTGSLVFLACTALSLFSALSVVSTRLAFYRNDLINSGRKTDVCVICFVVINGLGMYATWTTIASLINLGVAAHYKWNLKLSDELVSVICLCVLAFLLVVYSLVDFTVADLYTRFTLTPYPTVIWALSGIISKNWGSYHWSSIISAVLLGTTCVLFFVKLALVVYRERKFYNPYQRLKMGGNIKLQEK